MSDQTYQPSRAARAMLADAEQAEKAEVFRRDLSDKVKPLGLDLDMEQRDNPVFPLLNQILAPSVRSDLVRQLLGSDTPEPKTKSIWENYLPKAPTPVDEQAADALLCSSNFHWGPFMNRPEVEAALVDNVLYRFLEDLSHVSSYVDNGAKVLAHWKEKCPADYLKSEAAVNLYMEQAYRTVNTPANKEALDAIRQVRLLSHCLLHGHLTGQNEFAVSTELGGTSRQVITLSSPTLDRLQQANKNAYFGVARMELGVLDHAEYNTKPGDQAWALRKFLDMEPSDKRNPYSVLFARLVDEADPRAMMFQQSDGLKWTPEHCVTQITRAICPILALDVQKLRQKNMEPTLLYSLYKLSRHIRSMDIKSVYPMLGTGVLPSAMPPDFVLRFEPAWMAAATMTPAALASLGFNPIVHKGMREVVEQAKKLMPDMMARLDKVDAITFLKRAHTRDVLIEPVRVAIQQREFLRAFRQAYREGPTSYTGLCLQELKKFDPLRFGSMKLEEFEKLRDSWAVGMNPRDLSTLRSATYKAAVMVVGSDPEGPQRMENALMSHRTFRVMELRLHPSLQGKFPAQPSPDLDYSAVKAPSSGALASFEPAEYAYLHKESLRHSFLSTKHYNSLCTDGKGVLSPEMIAMQGIVTTANPDLTLRAYTCNHPALKEKQRRYCTMLTKEAEDTGIMLIPYQLENYEPGDPREPMNRIRTVRTTPKYLSAMSEALKSAKLDANPLYLANVLLNPDMLKVWGKIMIQRTAEGRIPAEQAEVLGGKLLEHLKFERFATGLKDPSVPVFAIEGEKKALSVLESQLRQFEHALKRMFSSENPETYDFAKERIPEVVIPIGTIGVWNTLKEPGRSDHVLNPAILRTVPLAGRTFIIAQDSDGKNNPSVTAAAAMAATLLKAADATPLYWKPPPGPGKGFDDWVEARAKTIQGERGLMWKDAVDASYAEVPEQLLPRCLPLRTGLTYGDITKAQATGADLQEFITRAVPVPAQAVPAAPVQRALEI